MASGSEDVAQTEAELGGFVGGIVHLQPLIAALLRATTTAEVADGFVDHGVAALGANAGALALIGPSGTALDLVRAVGYRTEIVELLRHLDLAAPVALATTARTGVPIWLATPEAIAAAFPQATPLAAAIGSGAHAVLPLTVDGRVLGALVLSFATPRSFGEAERRALTTAAELCAQALARVREAEAGRARLAELGEDGEQFRLLVQSVQDYAIFLLSPEGRVLSWNVGARRLKGYRAEEILGESFTRFYTPEDVAGGAPQLMLARAVKEGRVVAEGWRVRRDGSRFWAEAVLTALRDERGQLHGFAKVTRDLTERKQAEEARARASREEAAQAELRASRDQLAAILAGVVEGITVQDRAGPLVYANDEAARLCGFPSARELLAATDAEILAHFEVRDERGAPFPLDQLPGRRLLRDEPVVETLVQFRVRATGGVRWSLVNATPVRDAAGQVQLVVNVFHDVTERRRAEETAHFLAAASARLSRSLDYEQTLAEVAQLAVPTMADWCVVDLLDDHQQLRRIALAHVDPAKVRFAQDLARRYPADPGAAEGVWQVVRTGRPILLPEITHAQLAATARDEERLAVIRSLQMRSAIIVPLVARGRTLGAITLVRAETGPRYGPPDLAVAEDLAVRAALAIDNARLYREAQEQTETHVQLNAALREAMIRLEEALQARDEFLALASHDLKNPLTVVKGLAQFLKQGLARGRLDVEQAVSVLADIDGAATKLATQIDALLDLSHLRTGQPLPLALRPTDLVALAQRMVDEYQQTNANHRIRIETTEAILVGEWDSARLERSLGNLLTNAVKYSPNGGDVTVTVSRDGEGADAVAIVRVRDPGLGIPAADLARVFEPYERGANVAGRIAGAGLGLASVRQIVVQHGGKVAVESTEGQGSTFTLRLPLQPPASFPDAGPGETRP